MPPDPPRTDRVVSLLLSVKNAEDEDAIFGQPNHIVRNVAVAKPMSSQTIFKACPVKMVG
jgi:hypothetical protein